MLSYELAKQLKDAGFPQTSPDAYYINAGKNTGAIIDTKHYTDADKEFKNAKLVYIPTLSELMKACNSGSFALTRETVEWKATLNGDWTTAETPEEAVAKLWLALNGSVNEEQRSEVNQTTPNVPTIQD